MPPKKTPKKKSRRTRKDLKLDVEHNLMEINYFQKSKEKESFIDKRRKLQLFLMFDY